MEESSLRSHLQSNQNEIKFLEQPLEYPENSSSNFLEKNDQKIKGAYIALRESISHFTLSKDSLNNQRQITSVLIYLGSLFSTYSLSNFYNAIMRDESIYQSERRTDWIEFVNFVCSAPERSANLIALDQNRQKEALHLNDLYPIY